MVVWLIVLKYVLLLSNLAHTFQSPLNMLQDLQLLMNICLFMGNGKAQGANRYLPHD